MQAVAATQGNFGYLQFGERGYTGLSSGGRFYPHLTAGHPCLWCHRLSNGFLRAPLIYFPGLARKYGYIPLWAFIPTLTSREKRPSL